MISFSVLMRVHKRPISLRIALESIYSQTYKNIFVLCSFDSPDDTNSLKILEEYMNLGLNIKIFPVSPEGYPGCNTYLNYLCKQAKEDSWLHILDDDDKYIDNQVFDKLANIIELEDPSIIINKVRVLLSNHNIFDSPAEKNWKTTPVLHQFGSSNIVFPQVSSPLAKFNKSQWGDYDGLLNLYNNIDKTKIYWLEDPLILVKTSWGKEE